MWLLLCYPPTHSSTRFSVLQLLCDHQYADFSKADLIACIYALRKDHAVLLSALCCICSKDWL